MLLHEEIEQSFGDGPAHRPIEDRLAAGHRVVRRRRATRGAAALATLAVVGTSFAALAGQQESGSVVADNPGGWAASDDIIPKPADKESGLRKHESGLWKHGEFVLAEGVTELRRVDNPLGLEPPEDSVGLVVDDHGTRRWALAMKGDGATFNGDMVSWQDAGEGFSTFDLWLDDQVRFHSSEQGQGLALVAFADDGSLVASEPGVEILEQRAEPAMPASFAGEAEQVAVAKVTWKGELWFALANRLPGHPAQYSPTESGVADGATTIDEFLAWARVDYANEDADR